MKVQDAMSMNVEVVSPDLSICEAAKLMGEIDAGALPVGENDRLIGMVTDRDIAIRGVAKHLSPDALVSEVMSSEVLYCFEDQDLEEVVENMGEQQVRRMPVLNRDKRLVGILSLGDIALWEEEPDTAGIAVADISEPGGLHSQTPH